MLDLDKRMENILSKDFKYDIIDHPDSYPADEPQRRCPDIAKAKKDLNYFQKVKIEDGLRYYFIWA